MYKTSDSFHTPDSNYTTWRYMNFTKFVDLLISKQLFFNRSDKFEDPFEGLLKVKGEPKDAIEINKLTKEFYFLNCWHLSEFQSDAMWKIFLDTKNGIAIKSTVSNLINCFSETKEDIFISKIYYRDFNNITFFDLMKESQNQLFGGMGGTINQFNYKRNCFEHEKELRLYFIDYPIPHTVRNGIPRKPLDSKKININVNEMIQEVIIAPFADDWFKSLVENVIKSFGYNFNVTKSELYELID